MKIRLVALALVLTAPAQAADLAGLVRSVVDDAIVPAHIALADAGAALDKASGPECADLPALLTAYHQLYDRWEYLQFLTFGPVEAFNRGQRLHFWPDRKNVVARQTQQMLKDGQIDRIEGPKATFASVAVQGLPALEALLYPQAGQAAKQLDGPRCRMARAIGANLAGITAELLEGWQGPEGHRQAMLSAGSGNSPYGDITQAASRLHNANLGQLQAMIEVKLDRMLDKNAAQARPDKGEAVLSERSLRNLRQNLQGLRNAFAPKGQGFAAALRQDGKGALADKVLALFAAAETAAAAIPEPMEHAIRRPAGWKAADQLRKSLRQLQDVLTREVGPALNMQFGFNALDGDGG